ncbi:hypothetical protein [Mycolicibacterium vinylchloridicum]|uniref:hypothetical protein n=1 Tax=Mycolicibacterium vinylchloridicum TaxID=2736928 RepID=UPI0015C9E88B|nr:hypothetical protein [Mycolicibacterium vinylchloridicum]
MLAWARKEFGVKVSPSSPSDLTAAAATPADALNPPSYNDLVGADGQVLHFLWGGNPAFVDSYEWSDTTFDYDYQAYAGTKLDHIGTFADFQCGGSCSDVTPYTVVFVTQDTNDDGVMGCSYDSCTAIAAKPMQIGDIAPHAQDYGPIVLGYSTTAIQYQTYVMMFRDNAIPDSLTTLPESFLPVPPPPPTGDVTPPTAPVIRTSGVTDHSVILTVIGGTDNVGIVQYDIFRDDIQITTLSYDGTGKATYVDDELDADTTYRYLVIAEDAAGNLSGLSREVPVTTYSHDEWEYKSGNDPFWEKAWENVNLAFGWIPVVNDVLAAVSTAVDLAQLVYAVATHNKAQIYDEIVDLGGDAIGYIPFAKAINKYLDEPLDKVTEDLAMYLAGLLYTGAADIVTSKLPPATLV